MAEGSETPDGGQGTGPEGRPRRSEGDLLAERRARRAAESGELALMRRAEAAEATVQTLERHVSSLQQRLRELEDERSRTDELLAAERAASREREHELQRVKQREYAEQQLRLEAEERVAELTAVRALVDDESRQEIGRLDARLSASEHEARELGRRLETLQRRLAQAEREASVARPATGAEHALQGRLVELERRAQEIQRGLAEERAARERSEAMLESMREGHRRMELLLADMKGIVSRVSDALAAAEHEPAPRPTAQPERAQAQPSPPAQPPRAAARPETQGAEMADALAAAVVRLRARAEATPLEGAQAAGELAPADANPPAVSAPQAPPAPQQADATAASERPAPAPALPEHKHSRSLIGRLRYRRKQRKSR